ncbi:hypothetical protein EC396_04985 [Lutibacter sp. HS1-25]|uniref:hypothetical protein n=1 Tax=Lutibacter sp. HS1-25 TaxID=2485000 RepID=UPI0010119248|nr:hypothetical protein [Lutibacter sp. HS1-25]RXP59406.1 hypothetical protein EC396_04985 [Lutibacter sp. HS1-25]
MHKKLKADLVNLANSILEMEDTCNVVDLHKKAQIIYEKLCVLKFVESNLSNFYSEEIIEKEVAIVEEIEDEIVFAAIDEKDLLIDEDTLDETVLADLILKEQQEDALLAAKEQESVIEDVKAKVEEKAIEIEDFIEEPVAVVSKTIVEKLIEEEEIVVEPIKPNTVEVEKAIEKVVEEKPKLSIEQVEEIFETEKSNVKNNKRDIEQMHFSLEDEFKDAISADVATNLFERVTKENPVIETNPEPKPKSLNDALFSKNLQIGLNDRIGFVKHLFDGSQEDFNRVLSQLNSFDTEAEAKTFVLEFVKPDYDWSGKLEYEERLLNIIERRYL